MSTTHPVIGIFIEKKDVDPVFKDRHYELAYSEIVESLDSKGAHAVLLVGQSRYLGGGKFSMSWKPINTDGVITYKQLGAVTVDIIFDKDHFIEDDTVPVINSKLLKEICENKHLSYEVLQEFHPQSSVVYTDDEFHAALAALPGEIAVVKGLIGSSGETVFIGSKAEAIEGMSHVAMPYQVQEFIETGGGIPGVVDGRHDLRLLMMGGKPIIATLRTPPADGYKSNLSYGGTNRLVDLKDVPQELFDLASEIDKVLQQYGPFRLYSADFGNTAHGWKLFEVNGWPGVITRQRGEALARAYQEALSDYLIEMYQFYKENEEQHG